MILAVLVGGGILIWQQWMLKKVRVSEVQIPEKKVLEKIIIA